MGVSGQRHAPAALYPRERTPGTHCTGGWVGPRAGLDTEARGKIICTYRGSNLDRPVVQPVVRHYTDWATPVWNSGTEMFRYGIPVYTGPIWALVEVPYRIRSRTVHFGAWKSNNLFYRWFQRVCLQVRELHPATSATTAVSSAFDLSRSVWELPTDGKHNSCDVCNHIKKK
jgi:hypothetical protein